jgi:hypothetical protein
MDPRYKSPTTNVVRNEEDEFRDLDTITNVLKWLLLAGALLAVMSFVSSWMQIELLSRPFSVAEGEANDERERAIALLTVPLSLVTMVTFGRWILLANRNLSPLGAQYLEFTPGWALGWFFIPIANLWKPYQAMRALWRSSNTVVKPELVDSTWMLPVWWTLWLIASYLGNILMRLTLKAKTAEEFIASSQMSMASCVVDVALHITAALLVVRIWSAQRRQREDPQAVAPAPGFADAGSSVG